MDVAEHGRVGHGVVAPGPQGERRCAGRVGGGRVTPGVPVGSAGS